MRRNPTKRIEQYRITHGQLASDKDDGANGAFLIPIDGVTLAVIVSDATCWKESGLTGIPWEHVSVSTRWRTPTWEEMDAVKRIFWRDDETVIQLHVPRSEYVNYHEFCLNLWKPIGVEIPVPPSITVGFKS